LTVPVEIGVMTDDESTFEATPGEGLSEEDAHAPLDVEAAFDDVTVVIPTAREDNYTLDSLPEFVDYVVARDEGLNVARNRGVERAEGDWIVLADDDITFPTRLTAILLDSMHTNQLVGLEDFWPMEWILGRYMIFHRSMWERIDGFDERRPHGGDTDFAVRVEKAGGTVLRLPRNVIPHHDAESVFSKASHAEWLLYLLGRHPLTMLPKAVKLGLSNIGVLDPESDRKEYPEHWQSQIYHPPADGNNS
jgi:hypothetical protein